MPQYNIKNDNSIEKNYEIGLLPQRNQKKLFYEESSSRSNLKKIELSSENRRILKKTEEFSFQRIPLKEFLYTPKVQKQIYDWIKKLGWNFPVSSIKTIFTNHIFNYVYIWKNHQNKVIAYSICYFSETISHIAYVFYDPEFSRSNLPIRLVLQAIIDSHQLNLNYCYLGRFSENTGYYKRNMPGFEYFASNRWLEYNKN